MATTEDVEYDADGAVIVGRLALPDGEGVPPAALIAHAGHGLDERERELAPTHRTLVAGNALPPRRVFG